MIKQIEIFAQQMQRQLDANSSKGDGSGPSLEEHIVDFEYHKAKMILALKENNKPALKEFIADCANILMFIGNIGNLYEEEDNEPVAYTIKKNLFDKVEIIQQNIVERYTNNFK